LILWSKKFVASKPQCAQSVVPSAVRSITAPGGSGANSAQSVLALAQGKMIRVARSPRPAKTKPRKLNIMVAKQRTAGILRHAQVVRSSTCAEVILTESRRNQTAAACLNMDSKLSQTSMDGELS